jgi:hypothetical protein
MEKGLQVAVTEFNTSTSGASEGQTVFKIEITKAPNTWNVRRTFPQFSALHNTIKATQSDMPKLPKKKMFKLTKPEDLEKRRLKLDFYLKELARRQDLSNNQDFMQFLEVKFIRRFLIFFKSLTGMSLWTLLTNWD